MLSPRVLLRKLSAKPNKESSRNDLKQASSCGGTPEVSPRASVDVRPATTYSANFHVKSCSQSPELPSSPLSVGAHPHSGQTRRVPLLSLPGKESRCDDDGNDINDQEGSRREENGDIEAPPLEATSDSQAGSRRSSMRESDVMSSSAVDPRALQEILKTLRHPEADPETLEASLWALCGISVHSFQVTSFVPILKAIKALWRENGQLPSLQLAACWAVCGLTAHSAILQAHAVALGMHLHFRTIIKVYNRDPKILEASWKSLANLFKGRQAHQVISKNIAHSVLLKEMQNTLKVHRQHRGVQEAVCWCIANSTSNSPECKLAAAEMDLIEDVQKTIQTHKYIPQVLHAALPAVNNLINHPSNQMRALHLLLPQDIRSILRSHRRDAELQEICCWALTNLTAHNAEAQSMVGDSGVIHDLTAVMVCHQKEAPTTYAACWALRNLLVNTAPNREVALGLNALHLLSIALETHVSHGGVVEQACWAVKALASSSKAARMKAISEGLRADITAAQGAHRSNAAVSLAISSALQSLDGSNFAARKNSWKHAVLRSMPRLKPWRNNSCSNLKEREKPMRHSVNGPVHSKSKKAEEKQTAEREAVSPCQSPRLSFVDMDLHMQEELRRNQSRSRDDKQALSVLENTDISREAPVAPERLAMSAPTSPALSHIQVALSATHAHEDGDFLPMTLTAVPHAERPPQSASCSKSVESPSQAGTEASSSPMRHQAPGDTASVQGNKSSHQRKPLDVGSVGSACSLDNWIACTSTSPNDSPEIRKSKISRAWRLFGMGGAGLPRRKQRPTILEATTPPSTPASPDPATSSEATFASPQKDELPIDIYEPCVASVEGWTALGSRCLTVTEDEADVKKEPREEDCRREDTSAISESIDLSLTDGILANKFVDSQSKPPSLSDTMAITVNAAPGSVPPMAETAMSRDSVEHSPRQQETVDAAPDGPLSDTAKAETDSIKNIDETASWIPGPETFTLLTSPDPGCTEGSEIPGKNLLSARVTTHFKGIVGSLPQEELTSSTPAVSEGGQSSSLCDMPVTSSFRALAEADSPSHYKQGAQPLDAQATSQYAEQSAGPEVSADDLKLAFSNNAPVQNCDAWPASETVCQEEELPKRKVIQQQTQQDTTQGTGSLQNHPQPSASPALTAEKPELSARSRTDSGKTTRTIRLQSLRLKKVDTGNTPILSLSAESREESEHIATSHMLLPTDSASRNEQIKPEEGSKGDSEEFKENESGVNDERIPEEAVETSQNSVGVLQAKDSDEISPSVHSSRTHGHSSAGDSDGSSNSLEDTSHFVPTDDLEGSFALMDELISQAESSSFQYPGEHTAEHEELKELSCIPDPEYSQAENGAIEQLLCPYAPEDCQTEPVVTEETPCSQALDDGHAGQAPIMESPWPLTQEQSQAELSLIPELACPPAKTNDKEEGAGVSVEPCPPVPEEVASENPPVEEITCPSAHSDDPAELLPIADLPEQIDAKPLQRSVSVGTGDDWMGSIPDSSFNSSHAHMEGVAQGTTLGRDIAALKKQLVDRILASTKEELLLALKDTEMAENVVSPGNCHEEAAGSDQRVPIEPALSGTNDEAVASSSLPDGTQQDQQAHLRLQGMADSRGSVCTPEGAADLVSMTDDLLSMTDDFLVLADSLECEDSASFFSLQDELLHAAAIYEENEKHGALPPSQTSPGSGTTGAGIVLADGGSEADPLAPMDSDWPQIDVNADSTAADETLHRDEEQKSQTFTPPMVTNPIYLHTYSCDDSKCSHPASSIDTSSQLKMSFDQHMSPVLMAERVQKIAAPVKAERSQSAAGDGGIDKAIVKTGLELDNTTSKDQTCRTNSESMTMPSKMLSKSLSSVGSESLHMAAQLQEHRLNIETRNAAIHKSASAPLDLPAEQMAAVATENPDGNIKVSPLAGPEARTSSKDNGAIQPTTGNPTADRIIDRITALLGKRRTAEDTSIPSRGSSPHATGGQELKNKGSCRESTTGLPQSSQGRLPDTTSHQATDTAKALDRDSSDKTPEESTEDHPHKELSAGSEASVQINARSPQPFSTSFQPEPAGEAVTVSTAGWQDTEGDSGREVFSLRDGVVLPSEENQGPAPGPLEALASVPMYTEAEDLPLHTARESDWQTDHIQLSSDWVAKQHGSQHESSALSETQPSFEEPLKSSVTPWEVDSQVLNDTSIVSKASVSTGDGALRRLLELGSQREERLDKAPAAIAPDDEDVLLLSPKPRDYTAVTARVRELCMGKLNRYEDILDVAEADESYDLDDMLSGADMNVIGKPGELDQGLFGLIQSPSDSNDTGHPTPVTPIPSGGESHQGGRTRKASFGSNRVSITSGKRKKTKSDARLDRSNCMLSGNASVKTTLSLQRSASTEMSIGQERWGLQITPAESLLGAKVFYQLPTRLALPSSQETLAHCKRAIEAISSQDLPYKLGLTSDPVQCFIKTSRRSQAYSYMAVLYQHECKCPSPDGPPELNSTTMSMLHRITQKQAQLLLSRLLQHFKLVSKDPRCKNKDTDDAKFGWLIPSSGMDRELKFSVFVMY